MKKLLIVICVVAVSNVVFAKEIVQKNYKFKIENVKTFGANTYVVDYPEVKNSPEAIIIKTPSELLSKNKNTSDQKKKNSFKKKKLIYFGFNESRLDEGDKEKLKSLSNINIAGQIILIGYTDNIGSQEKNEMIAKERAKSVERNLNSIGRSNCKIFTKPKCCYLSSDNALNRRVEVIFNEVPERGGIAAN